MKFFILFGSNMYQYLVFGISGYTTTSVGDTEEYNGTSWSEQNNLPVLSGCQYLSQRIRKCHLD